MLRSKTAPTRLCAALGPYAAHALALGAGGVFSAAVLPGGAAPLGLALTIVMLLIAMTLSSRAPMDMAWLAAKCLLWQGILALLAIAAINGVTMYTYDYNGTRRRKKRRPTVGN